MITEIDWYITNTDKWQSSLPSERDWTQLEHKTVKQGYKFELVHPKQRPTQQAKQKYSQTEPSMLRDRRLSNQV